MAAPSIHKRATIRDVARAADVSHQTVSRVINGETSIAPDTRARVERAIARLAFRPNQVARSLATRRTKTVGIVVGDVASPFFPDVVRGVEDELSPEGYSLLVSSSRRDAARELHNLRHLLERDTDGVILGAPHGRPADLVALGRVPMVFLNRDVRAAHAASVWIDWERATAEVVAHLVARGHRRIALAVPTRDEAPYGSREDWYRQALTRARLPVEPAQIFRERISIEGGYAAGERLIAKASRATAVICHSDVMAIGVLHACGDRGVRVPQELSIVGWDDVPYARLVTPALTTVRVPRYELGRAAARTLLDLMAGRSVAAATPLPLELIHRASTTKGDTP